MAIDYQLLVVLKDPFCIDNDSYNILYLRENWTICYFERILDFRLKNRAYRSKRIVHKYS